MNLESNTDITVHNRSTATPLAFGDKFTGTTGDFYLIIAEKNTAKGFYFDHDLKHACLVEFNKNQLLDNFTFDQAYNDFSDKYKDDDETTLLAKMVDGEELITMNRLAYTVAICANIHGWSYDTRYCFGQTSKLPSAVHALFWFIQFNTVESLPLGNVAFRGRKGTVAIADPNATIKYYADLEELKHKFENAVELHEHCALHTEYFMSLSRILLMHKIQLLKQPK